MKRADLAIAAASGVLYLFVGWLLALLIGAAGGVTNEWWFHLVEVPLFLVTLIWALGGFIICWISLRRLFGLKVY